LNPVRKANVEVQWRPFKAAIAYLLLGYPDGNDMV